MSDVQLAMPMNWEGAYPEVHTGTPDGGFDVVVGNPPYIRGDWLTKFKGHFKERYQTFDTTADIYVYFYELGFNLLKPGGRLSFVVTNKWMKAAYAEPLRRFFGEKTWVESFVNLGHAKQVFEDADVFPSIIVLRKPDGGVPPATSRVCAIPREQLRVNDLSVQIDEEGHAIERSRLGSDPWSIEPADVMRVFNKIREGRIPLRRFAKSRLYTGIKTGCNDAFLIQSTAEKDAIVSADPSCAEIIRPYRAGEHMDRWAADWDGSWMIALKSSRNYAWPWSAAEDEAEAETIFEATYPSLYGWMKSKEDKLRNRSDQGVFWWELRSCAYWAEFERPKLIYQEIQYHPSYGADRTGNFANNKVMFIPNCDLYLLGVLNSAMMWWHNWWYLPHMKDEALTPVVFMTENLPIAEPTPEIRSRVETAVSRLVEIAEHERDTRRELLEYLRVQHGVAKPSQKLASPFALDLDTFLAEIVRIRGRKNPLSLQDHRSLKETHATEIVPTQALLEEARGLERIVNNLVIKAYGLGPEDVRLIWDTAPPRMPLMES